MVPNMNSTFQTQDSEQLPVTHSSNQVHKQSPLNQPNKPKSKKSKDNYDIEDTILDSILKDKIIQGTSSITNTWLCDPLYEPSSPFTVQNDSLLTPADSSWPKFKTLAIENGHIEFLALFENTFIDVLLNQLLFFNSFNKYCSTRKHSAVSGTSVFIIWLSKYLKQKITAFLFDFLVVFLYTIWKKEKSTEGLDRYFTENVINQSNQADLSEAEGHFYAIYGDDRVAYMDFGVILQYLVSYFLGNDLLETGNK